MGRVSLLGSVSAKEKIGKAMNGDHFSNVAQSYAEFRPQYPLSLYQWLRRQAPTAKRVWDVGCGSGQATLMLADHFAEVIATDISERQLAKAEARDNIRYWRADEHCPELAEQSIDLITVAQALHWFNLDRFYPEVDRVLKPEGILAVWTYSPIRLRDQTLNTIMQDYYQRVAAPWWPPGREHVDSGYRDLPFPFPTLPDPRIEMSQAMTIDGLCGYVRSWSASARCMETTGKDPTEELYQALLQHFTPEQTIEVYWRLTVRAGRKSA